MSSVIGVLVIGLSLSLVGCSGGSGPATTYKVTGTVKLPDGKTLENGGQILFRPLGEQKYPARGIINKNGTFYLSTFKEGDGAVAGQYKVMITPDPPEGFAENPAGFPNYKVPIDRIYQDPRRTPLEFTVKNDASENRFDIIVKP